MVVVVILLSLYYYYYYLMCQYDSFVRCIAREIKIGHLFNINAINVEKVIFIIYNIRYEIL